MKTINKIVSGFAMVALLASCSEKELPDSTVIPDVRSDAVVPTEIVATFVETKVTYNEIEAGSVYNLRPTWEVGDEIIALGEDGANYKFTVKTVTGDKSAILSGEVPANCSLHLIYCPGVSATSVGTEGLSLPINVDYTAQTGAQKTMPAVMFSDGEIKDGTGNFTFRNAGAVIGISAVKGVPSGSAISKITVEGENLSAATVTLDGSTLKLAATPAASDAISTVTLSGLTVTDANGTLSSPVFIAVPAGAVIKKVSASVSDKTYSYTLAAAKTASAGEYLYVKTQEFKDDPYNGHEYVEIAGLKWATMNVGATKPEDYGEYFAWGETTGHSLIEDWKNKWSDEYWRYIDVFNPNNYSFDWSNAPFNDGKSTYDATYFNSVKDTECPNGILALKNDAANVNWGGSWRMPTKAEFDALASGKYVWDSTNKGFTFGTSPNTIFLPTAGIGEGTVHHTPDFGYYWSSSLSTENPSHAYRLYYGGGVTPDTCTLYRDYGHSVRALSE